jgi:MOSC domain-containing protein YiiM
MGGMVDAVHQSASHTLKKPEQPSIRLLAGLGVEDDARGHLIRKAGVVGIVLRGGDVHPTDPIRIEWPSEPHRLLEPV